MPQTDDGPLVICWADKNFQGTEKSFTGPTPYVGDDFNDKCSSFKIRGNVAWLFFDDANFQGQFGAGGGAAVPPGDYPWIEDVLGPGSNDQLSSLKPA
jgi:hypothetical protein